MSFAAGDIIQHYKGNKYVIISVNAIHHSTEEKLIVYRALYEFPNDSKYHDYQVFVRPVNEFYAHVVCGNTYAKPRFEKCDAKSKSYDSN